MLKGDLVTTSLPEVLRTLAETSATGCLRVTPDTGEARPEDAQLYLRGGRVYAVTLPGRSPRLGARLVASGDLSPADLAEATEAQRTELQGWRLGELLVHLGVVEQPSSRRSWRSSCARAPRAPAVDHRPLALPRLRAHPRGRRPARAGRGPARRGRPAPCRLRALVPEGAYGVVVLSAAGEAPETQSLDPQAWSLLCAVDGERTVAALAAAGGFTLHEAGHLVAALVDAGLVEVEAPAAPVVVEAPVAPVEVAVEPAPLPVVADEVPVAVVEPVEVAPVLVAEPVEPAGIAARLAAALKSLDPDGVGMVPTPMAGEQVERSLERPVDEDLREDSVGRASASLASALGEPAGELDLFPVEDRSVRLAPVVDLDAKQAERRARDAQELAERQAEVEEARRAEEEAAGAAAEEAAAATEALAESRRTAELQAAAFAELSASASLDEVAPGPPAAPVVTEPEPVVERPAPAPRSADTAALLRELSSLGLEEEPSATVVPPPRPAPPVAVATKKRKGLFGR
jgi:hypothetical protein